MAMRARVAQSAADEEERQRRLSLQTKKEMADATIDSIQMTELEELLHLDDELHRLQAPK